MASEERPAGDSVVDPVAVAASANRYGFRAAVALLERLHPDAPRVGGLGPATEEVVRFRHDPGLVFSAGDISSITITKRKSDPSDQLSPSHPCYEIVTTFLGLTGASTPLPTYFAEEIAHEDPDAAIQREFLDIFHHRLLSLLYRLQSKYDYSSEFISDTSDVWSKRMLALAGIDIYENKPATKIPPWQLLRLAPLLSNRSRTGQTLEVALENVLEDVLQGAHIKVEQFVGRWVEIEDRQRMRLGVSNTRLGDDSVIGVRIFDRGGKIRLVVGPLDGQGFRRFLPDGDQIAVVREVVGLFCRDQLEFDMELVLAANATPTMRLSSTDGSKLGLDSWIGSREHEETRVIVEVPFDAADDPPRADSDSSGANGAGDGSLEHIFDSSNSSRSLEEMPSSGLSSGERHHAR